MFKTILSNLHLEKIFWIIKSKLKFMILGALIMAILAGALAPALIKYINKSRRSADISNADTIRTACQTAMSDEDAMVAIGTGVTGASVSDLKSSYGAFSTEISSILGNSTITSKYFDKGNEFTVDINVAGNTVIVKAGSQQVSPQP